MRKLQGLLLLPLLAAMGCPSSQGNGCLAGMRVRENKLVRWEVKQDVKWNRFVRDMNRKLNS